MIITKAMTEALPNPRHFFDARGPDSHRVIEVAVLAATDVFLCLLGIFEDMLDMSRCPVFD